MGRTKLCEYDAYITDAEGVEHRTGCENVKEAKAWIRTKGSVDDRIGFVYVKVVLWPQTAKARKFCQGRADFIVVTKDGVEFHRVGSLADLG